MATSDNTADARAYAYIAREWARVRTKTKKAALDTMRRLGIIDKRGRLTKNYRQ